MWGQPDRDDNVRGDRTVCGSRRDKLGEGSHVQELPIEDGGGDAGEVPQQEEELLRLIC